VTRTQGPLPSRSPTALGRRALLQRAGVIGATWAGLQLTGCSDNPTADPASSTTDPGPDTTTTGTGPDTTTTDPGPETTTVSEDQTVAPATSSGGTDGPRVLLAYFSRAGENYYYGDRIDLTVGNTQVVADLIRAAISVDVYRIEAADPYPDGYDDTVARNVREQETNARPAIAIPLPNLDGYDTVLLGSGVWNVRPPMIMSTFADSVDLTGKRLVPFVTYAVSGLGRTIDTYTALAPGATIGEALAVQGEEAADAGGDVDAWLRRIGLLST
jgi:flavodoxin